MSRKAKHEKGARRDLGIDPVDADDKGFQERLMSLLEWLADRDPVKAARLVGDYLEDLTEELGPKAPKPAKG